MDKDTRRLVKELERQGFETRATKRGRIIVAFEGDWITTLSRNPSDWRANRNALAQLKRAGFRYPEG